MSRELLTPEIHERLLKNCMLRQQLDPEAEPDFRNTTFIFPNLFMPEIANEVMNTCSISYRLPPFAGCGGRVEVIVV